MDKGICGNIFIFLQFFLHIIAFMCKLVQCYLYEDIHNLADNNGYIFDKISIIFFLFHR